MSLSESLLPGGNAFLHRHTMGLLWDAAATGLLLATNLFLMIALLRLAVREADCHGEPDKCRGKIYGGFRPTTFITTIVTIGQLSAAVAMPLAGTLVDYTSWTRRVGSASGWLLCGLTLAQGLLLPRLLPVAILQAVSIACYITHQTVVLSYLPGLGKDDNGIDVPAERHRVNAFVVVFALTFQLLALAGTAAFYIGLNLGRVDAARVCQLAVGALLAIIYGLIWHDACGYAGRFVEVAAKTDPGERGIWRAAAADAYQNYGMICRDFPDVANFLHGYAFSNAAAAGFGTLAVVFLNDHLSFSPLKILSVFFAVPIIALPAAAASTLVMARIGAMKTFLYTVACFAASMAVAPAVLCGPACGDLIWIFVVVWGVCVGVYYSANTAEYALLVPEGQEGVFMAYYQLSATILSWGPPAIYSLLSQVGASASVAPYILAGFFGISLFFFVGIDDGAAPAAAGTRRRSEDGIEAARVDPTPPPATTSDDGVVLA